MSKKEKQKNKKYTAIICAAGQGKRLRPYTDKLPKVLVKVGKKTILEYILDSILGCGIKNIIIVVGYKKDLVKKKIGIKYKTSILTYVDNDEYERTDNLYSLWLSRNKIKGRVIFINGDVVFNKEILESVIKNKSANGVVTDFEVKLDGDAMRVHGERGKLLKIGKRIAGKAHGTAFGVYKLSVKGAREYFKIAGDFFKRGPRRAGFVVPLRQMAIKMPVYLIRSPHSKWLEIDTVQDLIAARKKIKNIL